MGTRSLGTALIIVGMAALIATSVWSLIDQRRRACAAVAGDYPGQY